MEELNEYRVIGRLVKLSNKISASFASERCSAIFATDNIDIYSFATCLVPDVLSYLEDA